MLHHITQSGSCPGKARPHGSDRHVEDPRYFLVTQLFSIPQPHDDPVVFRKAAQGRLEPLNGFDCRGPPLGIGRGIGGDFDGFLGLFRPDADELQLTPPFPPLCPRIVPCDLKHPGTDLRVTTKPVQATPDAKEDFLGCFERLLVVFSEAAGKAPHGSAESFVERIEFHQPSVPHATPSR